MRAARLFFASNLRCFAALPNPVNGHRAAFPRPLTFAALLCACGASQPPGPYYGDEQYLVLGVRPDAEAIALALQIEATGYGLSRQLNGQNFTALGFADEEGLPSKVRVVTSRGITLALDSEAADALHEGMRYELLDAPLLETHDADGDGFEEVFVEAQPASGEPPCILVYRVRDSGFVDPVPGKGYAIERAADATADAWRDPQFCETEEEPPAEDAQMPATAGGDDVAPKPLAPDAGTAEAPAPSPPNPPASSPTPAAAPPSAPFETH
jgi:hypothetical protein